MDGMRQEAAVGWTIEGLRSFVQLLRYLQENEYHWIGLRRDILAAVNALRYAPLRCRVERVRRGRVYRRLIVRRRYLVYYIYFPPTETQPRGRVSIRAVKHGAKRRPFCGVRDDSSTRRADA